MVNYTKLLKKFIPGGAHTYSRGSDTFPSNAPEILLKGKGVIIEDNKKKKFIDYGMGLRSVNIGYAENEINQAAFKGIEHGNNLTRPSLIELKAAKVFLSIIKKADMVKFAKNGSTAVTAAVKLARAYTNKNIILRCYNHPFFSFDDWFIGSTVIKRGIPKEISKLTDTFFYNDIESLKKKIKQHKNQVACVVIEPAADICPKITGGDENSCCNLKKCDRDFKKNHFLKQVQNICHDNNILFILDEMITGFRWHIGGAQEMYNLNPDLSTFGKAMANGFSVAAVCGKRNIMELGSIDKIGNERVFLMSTTHGAEMGPLNAFIQTVKFIKKKNVINKNWDYGKKLIDTFNNLAREYQIENFFVANGPACSPIFKTYNLKGKIDLGFRTLFVQEMIKQGVLMPWISIAYRHNEYSFRKTKKAASYALKKYSRALKIGLDKFLHGNSIKPVFRKFN